MRKIGLALIALAVCFTSLAQNGEHISFTALRSSDASKPLLIYLSGDGGMNSFSTSFLKSVCNKGYSIIGIDAKDYFWKKKTPEQASAAVGAVTARFLRDWNLKSFILIGYSFGADVAPFILTRLPTTLSGSARQLVLLSPSATTSFEIKLTEMLGIGGNKGVSVGSEINKITKPVLLVFGNDEKEFPLSEVNLKNKKLLFLAGGHHYDGDVEGLLHQLINRFQ